MTRLLVAAALTLFAGFANAALIILSAGLSGPQENPPNASLGTGSATVTLNDVAHTLRVQVSFSGLSGLVLASHIHCCTSAPLNVGVATQLPTFNGFPLGVTSGVYDQTFDLLDVLSYNPAFITANGGTVALADAALEAGLLAGRSYLNVHTNLFPGGEIRGFLRVPEPGTLALLGLALAGLAFRRRTVH